MTKVAKRRGYSYRTTDLDYPAIAVTNPMNALGAKISGGKAFAFGRSVDAGVKNLRNYYKETVKNCPATKWVLGGYSQGAIVATRAVGGFDASKVIYVGLLGDPWVNLPEGKGIVPNACLGKRLSDYRVYAPYCRTHTGSLGARNPYVPSGFAGKYGLWCNKNDYVCGSTRMIFNISGHLRYAEDKELNWMADKVERRLSYRSNVGTRELVDEEESEDIIQAHLSADEYFVSMYGDVTFDASESFSTGHEIVEYQ